jgi:aspartate/methionine/tyrosine aminotransferase
MDYRRMPIEIESPEERGYHSIRHNLAESSMTDRRLGDLGISLDPDLVLQYGDHRGHPELRALLAAESGGHAEHVLLTPGAAGALFIAATSLLGPNDHLLVLRPNYATNLETPRAIGCEVTFLDLEFDRHWEYSALKIAALLRPNTRVISITTPHNPTGTVLPADELGRILALAESRDIRVLVDETYRDLALTEPPPFATAYSRHAVSIGSLSKAYGLPGLRVGWLITHDADLAERFLAAKEQMVITGPTIEEHLGWQVYRQRAALRPEIVRTVTERIAIVRAWLGREARVEWVEPRGGVVGYPRIRPAVRLDIDRFYQILNEELGTYVGAGHWFETDRRYFRIGFGWPTAASLGEGLSAISETLDRAAPG